MTERTPTLPSHVTFGGAIMICFRKYADFTGVAGRPEFWWWVLFTGLVSTALNAFNVYTPSGSVLVGSSLSSVWSIAVLLPTLAVAVRRLRDAGRAWAELFWILLPIAGLIILIVRFCEPSQPPRTVEGTAEGVTP